MRYLDQLFTEAFKRYKRLEDAETAAENRARRSFRARNKEFAIANAEGERAAGEEATANAAAAMLPKGDKSKRGRRAARRTVSRLVKKAKRSRRNERKANTEGSRQGDRHWDARDKAIDYRDKRAALTGESYRQIGYIIAEAMELELQAIHNKTEEQLRKTRRGHRKSDRRKGQTGENRGRRAEDRS